MNIPRFSFRWTSFATNTILGRKIDRDILIGSNELNNGGEEGRLAIVSRDHLVSVTGIRAPAVKAHTVQRARFISQFRGGRFSSDKSSFPNLPLPVFCLHQRQGKPVRRNKRMEESVGFLIRHDRNEREKERKREIDPLLWKARRRNFTPRCGNAKISVLSWKWMLFGEDSEILPNFFLNL